MAKTPDTSATSYLSAAEAVKRLDWRVFSDLCSDAGSRITDSATLQANPNFLAILLDASGLVEQACLVGKRYVPADLAALVTGGGAGAAGLYRLIARLTICLAYERRADIEMKQPWMIEWCDDHLQKLREGERIFPFVETEEAGLPDTIVETAADVEARNGIVVQSERYWGRRSNRRTPRE